MLPVWMSVLCSTMLSAVPPVAASPATAVWMASRSASVAAMTETRSAESNAESYSAATRWLDEGARPVPVHRAPEGERATPEYARWGKVAVAKTAARYPDARVVDYLHVGRKSLGSDRATEQFKLWLRGEGKEFGVYVDVTFNPKTEQLISVTFRETPR
ncbi:MAG: YqzG/YhdC family protein [Alicyclobacillus herbarius]|uniref:YqzG/YhdC family protein n=1 Tax=Alicyclobacillus herbarius TaxID=122960 RepID=UPI002353CA7F|nr:YqzG/YhdC family protein [Alicyclobacillus herbarius]MCL6633271.1 YqzG/YhdC family protein [Alicyclobacillus herbarius]